MAKGLVLDIAADSRQAQKAIGDVGEALEDVGDSLDDVVKDSDKGTARMERDFREMARDVKRESKTAYDAVKKDSKEAARESSEAVQSFREDAASEFAQFASSATGSVEEVADGVQGLLGGLAASIPGPVGIASAGIAAIGGAALATTLESAERTREAITEHFKAMASEGIEEWSKAQAVIARMTDAYAEHGDEIKAISDEIGVPAELVAQAWAGVPESMELVTAKMAEARDKAVSLVSGDFMKGAEEMRFDRVVQPLNDAMAVIDSSQAKFHEFAAWQDNYLRDVVESAGAATKEVDELGNVLLTLEDGTTVVIDADTGLASQNIDKFKGDLDGIPETIDTKVSLTHNASDAIKDMHRQLANANLSLRLKLKDQYGRDL